MCCNRNGRHNRAFYCTPYLRTIFFVGYNNLHTNPCNIFIATSHHVKKKHPYNIFDESDVHAKPKLTQL